MKRSLHTRVAAALLAFGALGALGMTSSPSKRSPGDPDLVLRGVAVWSPGVEGALPVRDVAIRGARVTSVAESDRGPGLVAMPGLVNGHAHMMRDGWCSDRDDISLDTARQILLNFQVEQAHGVTTIVDLGAPLAGVIGMRDGRHGIGPELPELLVSGPVLTAPGGYPLDYVDPEMAAAIDVVATLQSPADAVAEVDRLADAGVDVIKLAVMETSYTGGSLPVLEQEALDAIVRRAHARGLPAFAHAHTELGYRAALDAGADVIAHSSFDPLPDEVIEQIVDSGTVVIPTLWAYSVFHYVSSDPEIVAALEGALLPSRFEHVREVESAFLSSGDIFPPDLSIEGISKAQLEGVVAVSEQNLARLHAAGAQLGFGTDAGYCFSQHDSVDDELVEMWRAGVPADDVLRAATSGLDAVLGRTTAVAEGARADLVLLRGDPREDLRLVADPVAVLRGGEFVFCAEDAPDDLCAATPTEPAGAGRAAAFGLTLWRAMR